MKEYICECGGFVYRKGLDDNSYTCVRCKKKYSKIELDNIWLNKFKEKNK